MLKQAELPSNQMPEKGITRMHYVLALSVISLFLYFRFGKKVLALFLFLLAALCAARGMIPVSLAFAFVGYLMIKSENLFKRGPELGKRQRRETGKPMPPTLKSRYLTLHLNPGNGDISGRVQQGLKAGHRLEDLAESQLRELKVQYEKDDKESAGLLYAYLDYAFPAWRKENKINFDPSVESAGQAHNLTRYEALAILGLTQNASGDEIKKAHRQLMKKFHPDQGGAAIIAARINMAKDALL